MNLSPTLLSALVGIEQVASSRARLLIASLLSVRPRTLGELAELTGISVQGVLKHLGKLREFGSMTELELRGGKYLKYRKLYSIQKRRVGDFSFGDLMIAHISRTAPEGDLQVQKPYDELESLAEDMIISRRRIRGIARRIGKQIEDVAYSEERLERMIKSIGLEPEEQQIASILFTEDRPAEARRLLSRHYGCERPEDAIREVMARMRRA